MEESISDKLIIPAANIEIHCFLKYQVFQYRFYKRLPLFSIPSHTNSVYDFLSYFFTMSFNIILPSAPGSSKFCLIFSFHHQFLYFSSPSVPHALPNSSALILQYK